MSNSSQLKAKKPKKDKPFDLDKFIEKKLRDAYKKAPMYAAALNAAKEEYFIPAGNGNPMRRVRFVCAGCGRKFDAFDKAAKELRKEAKKEGKKIRVPKNIAVDHIVPVVDVATGRKDWDDHIKRLFCPVDNLQVLCNYPGERDGLKSCHKIKTAEENKMRVKPKKRKDQ